MLVVAGLRSAAAAVMLVRLMPSVSRVCSKAFSGTAKASSFFSPLAMYEFWQPRQIQSKHAWKGAGSVHLLHPQEFERISEFTTNDIHVLIRIELKLSIDHVREILFNFFFIKMKFAV